MTRILLFIFISTSIYSQTNSFLRINSVLEDIYFWDQDYRKSKNNCSSFEIHQRDSINIVYVNYIVSHYGFPTDKERFSLKAFNGIYYSIQHADLNTQKKYLQQIKDLSDKEILNQKQYAMLYDRILVRSIGKQKFGEQRYLDTLNNFLVYFPFINIDSVQIFRQQIGLEQIDLSKKTTIMVK